MQHFASFIARASVGLQRPTEPLTIKNNSQIDVHILLLELVTPISPQLGLASLIFVVSTKCIDPWVLDFMVSTIHATINGEIVFRWILIFVVYVNHEIHEN
jgi:hypothetical protein